MMLSNINLFKFKDDYIFSLHKVNKLKLRDVDVRCIESLTRSISDIDDLVFKVYKYEYNQLGEKVVSGLYEEVMEERLICVNNQEYFVIKDVSEDSEKDNPCKSVKCYSLEHKLTKNTVEFEDMGIVLIGKGDEDFFNLFDYLYDETGWKVGHIDDSVAYEAGGETKIRWQDSVSTTWYSFFMETISESFNCLVHFDTYNKTVNLYDINTVGEDIELYLSKDNYINKLMKKGSTGDIVTKLRLVGREDMDVGAEIVTGLPYLEDYSYFKDNGEMSNELVTALDKYEEMTAIRKEEWDTSIYLKIDKEVELLHKQNELYIVYDEIKIKEIIKKEYDDKEDFENSNIIWQELVKLKDKRAELEIDIRILEEEVRALQGNIDNINILCQKKHSTDENGKYIFTDELLDELKEFVYSDTYVNDSFILAGDVVKQGERELSLKSKPTYSFDLDLVNFLDRIIDDGNRQHFEGNLRLADIVIIYDKENDREEFVYLVGFNLDFKSSSLNITISNKKLESNSTREIADFLKQAKETKRMVSKQKYLWIQQKNNKINL